MTREFRITYRIPGGMAARRVTAVDADEAVRKVREQVTGNIVRISVRCSGLVQLRRDVYGTPIGPGRQCARWTSTGRCPAHRGES